ncbi:MAG TPA: tryptophan--tRNA ligase [Rhodocyclaceae bacterium]|nr:tryptophan--tRNA ligase [Rhodocyclaceae bacterium]
MYAEKVLSGMRPTGRLHLGHYHGVLANWIKLQHEYPCLFFVADWHALTTAYDEPGELGENTHEMVIDWLAAGVDPAKATIFIQSHVPEHAELHLLLSMMTPLGWLERVPTYKDQQEKLTHKDLTTYGFLGYPLLQAADILIYRANRVPVGEDQVPHIEFTREIARRFNHLYGREVGFEDKARASAKKLGGKQSKLYDELRTRYQEKGDDDALAQAQALLAAAHSLSHLDRERLAGWLEGHRKMILIEPNALLTAASRMPGLDGQKMSKSYANTITLREEADSVTRKIRTMQTDPQRMRRHDPGTPEKCPVWQLHQVYSNDDIKSWVQTGCRSAGIGCLDCKQPVIDAVLQEQEPMRERAKMYQENPQLVERILDEGAEKARTLAQETMRDVRSAIGLGRNA